jgi:hypothetical protein
MGHELRSDPFATGSQGMQSARVAEALRCDICERRLGDSVFYLEETGDVPEPRRSWTLCAVCNDAVHEHLAQSPVRSPVRLRVAVGMVASERTPMARRAQRGQMTDRAWMKLFFWLFLVTMLVHLAVVVAIAGIR